MSAIFISHSSKDNAIAGEVKAKLVEQGHRSVFLDFDPEEGIPAGRNWEKELYASLRGCQAVIVLCSEHSMASPWCFAEITQARALGKHLFPLKIAACQISPLLSDVQVTDLAENSTEGYRRLWFGLKKVGLNPMDLFDWDGSRSPYPGLLSFQEQDAAVYFGRDAAIQGTMETLNRLQHLGGARLMLVLGASGSGKSSLVRAGVVPRLKRDKDRWLVLEPFRPLGRPFDGLAMVLAGAFTAFGNTRDWKSIREALKATAGDASSAYLVDLANDLRVAAGRREATVLLVVDQFEELLGRDIDQSASFFLRLLKAGLGQPGNPFLVIATLRSDFLGVFQTHEVLQDLLYEPLPLPQMALADFAQVIEGPAKVAGIELEAGLAQAMVADTATDDALPLLAFTLRELWDRYSGDGRLTLEAYRDRLGGLKGSVARAAETVCTSLSSDQERHLHKAFLAMVRIDEEGRYIRKPAHWAELPEDVHDLLERFVQARLLISRGEGMERILEVAHDALFRGWDRLSAWLNLDREFLLWRQRLHGEITDWERTGHDDSTLLRGPVLAEAKRWLSERGSDLSPAEQGFIQKSDEREVQELQRWKALYAKALSRQLAAQAASESDPRVGLLLCVEAVRRYPTVEAQRNLLDLLMKTGRVKTSLFGHTKQVSRIAFSPDGKTLVSVGVDGTVVLWDMECDVPAQKCVWQADHWVTSLDFSSDGRALATGGNPRGEGEDKGCVALWDAPTGKKLAPAPESYARQVSEVRFSPDGTILAVASWDGAVHLWDMRNNRPKCEPFKDEGSVLRLAFSPDGKILASISGRFKLVGGMKPDNWINVWDVESGQRKYEPLKGHDGAVACLTYSPDGTILLSGGYDGIITFWDAGSGDWLLGISPKQNGVSSIAMAPDSSTLVSGSPDGSIVLCVLGNLEITVSETLKVHQQGVMNLAYSPDGSTLASASLDKSVILWNLHGGEPRSEPLKVHDNVVVGIAFDQRGSSLLSGSAEGEVALLDLDSGVAAPLSPLVPQEQESTIWNMVFSSDLHTAACGYFSKKTIHIWNPMTGEAKCQPLTFDARLPTIALSSDGMLLAYVSNQAVPVEGKGEILLWDIARAEFRAKLPCGQHGLVTSLAFSQDGSMLASGFVDGSVLLWDMVKYERKTEQLYSHNEQVLSLAFSPDGKTLASGSGTWFGQGENTIILWDIERGQCQFAPLKAHKNDVASLAFSPDGLKLASASGSIHANVGEADIRLWDVASGLPLSPPLLGHRDIVRCVAFSLDGKWLASGSKDGTIILWNMDLADWVKFAALKAGRELSPEEWERYLPDEPYHKISSNLSQ